MKGLIYQLKSVGKDRFCILSFLLPVVTALALNLVGGIDLSSLGELQFGVAAGDVALETERWLMRYGSVTVCQTREELVLAVKEPSTNLIGVEMDGDGIRTIISGSEWAIIQQAAGTLPALYKQRETVEQVGVQVLERPDILAGYQHIFAALTLLAAVFMGCVFNAMNIISEKEDGVALINEILPMTLGQYMVQKIFVGFVFGCLSAVVTAAVCFRLPPAEAAVLLALIVLSAFAAALIGLLIGRISEGLMAGVVYIKIVMIVFLAVPMLYYLTVAGTGNKVLTGICFLIPSSAAFEGIMELADGGVVAAGKDMVVLAVHGVVWVLLYLLVSRRRKKRL